ncbi:MAG: pro-sigmaK processing inhibitor BofA [Clostridiaceae bacterium]|jgi:inhibitor of the pro-sigma K processing machinery|nr:pro-sigmaK processing inhibitor BofA [Clostridiaceae bacterium]
MVNVGVVFAYVIGIVLLFIFARLFLTPLKTILKLVLNSLMGAAAILLANWAGSLFGFHMALNIYTAFIVGTLGIPGFILLAILKLIFK